MPTEQTTNIKVAVRVRPYNRRELEQNQRCIIKVLDKTTLLFDPDDEDDEFFFQGTKQNYRDITKRVHKKLSMEFDYVFDTEATNAQVFEDCTRPLVDSVLDGYNCSVFVYGATGAGKTFTMLGSESYPGLTFLTMQDLFAKVLVQSDLRKFDVGVSYLEVYNEQVMNLLTKSGPLKLREDSNGVVVSGLMLKPIHSAEELLDLLVLGNQNRTQHPTDANAESSRSHAIFQVHIRITDRKTGIKRMVKLSMIDLAGSERAASTKGLGLRFKEGASINKSLLALGNCINKLADGQKHIPYRDSNLTRILKDSLGGNCRTLMVANASMSSLTYEDTYNTLKYASRAKKIRSTLRQNALKSNMPKDFYIKKVNELMAENERLGEAQKSLEAKMTQLQKTAAISETNATVASENELKPWYSKMDAVYASVIKTQEYVIGLQSKIKNLNFRNKLMGEADAIRKIITLNHNNTHENLDNFTTSTSQLAKQVESHKTELSCWRKKLQDAYKDLDKLKREMKEAKCANILQMYQRNKDQEIQAFAQNTNINHISSINTELVLNSHKQRRALTMACELLQKCYAGTTDQKLSAEMEKSLLQIQRQMIGSDKMSTVKDESNKDNDENLDFSEVNVLVNGGGASGGSGMKRPNTSDEEDTTSSTVTVTANKRQRQQRVANTVNVISKLKSSTDSNVFKMPKVMLSATTSTTCKMNETHVVFGASSDEEQNETYDEVGALGVHGKPASGVRTNLINNILSEQITQVPSNKDHLKNVLLKSKNFNHQGLLKTVAAGVQKENKKYSPNRIRKSPRSAVSKAIATTSSCLKKQSARAFALTTTGHKITGAAAEPTVRINRAASFRVKK